MSEFRTHLEGVEGFHTFPTANDSEDVRCRLAWGDGPSDGLSGEEM